MAKKTAKKTTKKAKKTSTNKSAEKPAKTMEETFGPLPADMPDEARKKLEAIKKKLDKFKDKVMEKFSDYVLGIALLPPSKDEDKKEMINVMVLVDDNDSQKMTKEELQKKLQTIIKSMAEEIDKNLNPDVLLITELWQSLYDGKNDLTQAIAMSAPIHDNGMLAAVKIAEIHKNMVLKKFEKYIVAYVLAGSLVQGKATPESDIDVFIVIDDTDVKRMTRAELKDKLRAIIMSMGVEAGEATGIKNKLNIQVYIMTDFWDYIKEASPVIFTFLRDGVPFYDRGIFMPWKQLLKMGRIKPSPEAIDLYKGTGEQMIDRMKLKMKEMVMEDTFWATLTPTQAALMMYGIPPPTPKETPAVVRDVFVKKAKLLEEEYAKIIETLIKTRKDLEHGTKKTVTGEEVQKHMEMAEKYLKRLGKLFEDIESLKEKESVLHIYESTVTVVRDILKLEGVEKVADTDIIKNFEKEVIHKGLIPERYLRILKEVVKAKKDYDSNKLTKAEVQKISKESRELMKYLVEHIQRVRGRELERAKIRVKHGNKFGEVILFDATAFIVHDLDQEEKDITKASIKPDGSLHAFQKATIAEMEHAIATMQVPKKVFIKEPIFENMKEIFGKDVEVLLQY